MQIFFAIFLVLNVFFFFYHLPYVLAYIFTSTLLRLPSNSSKIFTFTSTYIFSYFVFLRFM